MFVRSNSGLYILVEAMTLCSSFNAFLIVASDGLRTVSWDKKHFYVHINDALKWLRRECKFNDNNRCSDYSLVIKRIQEVAEMENAP